MIKILTLCFVFCFSLSATAVTPLTDGPSADIAHISLNLVVGADRFEKVAATTEIGESKAITLTHPDSGKTYQLEFLVSYFDRHNHHVAKVDLWVQERVSESWREHSAVNVFLYFGEPATFSIRDEDTNTLSGKIKLSK